MTNGVQNEWLLASEAGLVISALLALVPTGQTRLVARIEPTLAPTEPASDEYKWRVTLLAHSPGIAQLAPVHAPETLIVLGNIESLPTGPTGLRGIQAHGAVAEARLAGAVCGAQVLGDGALGGQGRRCGVSEGQDCVRVAG